MKRSRLKLLTRYSFYLSILFLLVSCSTGNKLTKLTAEGGQAYENGNYIKALHAYEQVIEAYREDDNAAGCPVYGDAGQAALQLGDVEKGTGYLELAEYYGTASADDLYVLANTYREMDNLSKEMEALEAYEDSFPEDEKAPQVRKRLFELYVESENWQKAVDIWPGLDGSAQKNPLLMEGYFRASTETGNYETADSLAPRILTLYPESIPVLEYLGEKYYNKAEDRYQAEMKAYENNKTRQQYAQLLKAFETVTDDFKTSLGYFKRLYEIDPSSRYASYLANIYARLDDKEKSEYYRSKSQ